MVAFDRKAWMKEYSKKYRADNREKLLKQKREHYHANAEEHRMRSREWAVANKELKKALDREYYQKNKESICAKIKIYREANPEIIRKRKKKYCKNNYEHVTLKKRIFTAKRRAMKLRATPSYADLNKISRIYRTAHILSIINKAEYHVDHIIPLQGKLVSGFHHEDNLQIIGARHNNRKNNLFTPKFTDWEYGS